MKLNLRQWLLLALGAVVALPYAVRAHGAWPVGALVIPLAAVAIVLSGPQPWRELWRDRVTRLLLAFLVVTALSLPVGLLVFHNSQGLRSYAYQVALVLNFAAGFLILRRRDDIEMFIRGYVAVAAVAAAALALYLLQAGILQNAHSFHGSASLDATIYGWPNSFSVLLSVALVLCLYVVSTTEIRWLRRAYIAAAVALAACLVLTFSKTGWVVFGVAAWMLWVRYWKRTYIAALIALAIVGGVVLYLVTNESFHMQVFTLRTLGERFLILGSVLRYVNPLVLLFGSGSLNLDTLLASHAHDQLVPGVELGGLSTHNELLAVLVKGGLLSLVLLVAALVIVGNRVRNLARSGDALGRYWYAAVWAIVASLFAGETLHYWPVASLFWVMAGAMARSLAVTEATAERPKNSKESSEHVVPA